MSEYVVRMEMNGVPDCCGLCDPLFAVVCATKHDQTIDKMMLRAGRPSWCPIICQLPEGHGELIDRSKLFDWYTDQRTKYPVKQDAPQFGTMMMYEIFGEIEDAPTIVPADKAERSNT